MEDVSRQRNTGYKRDRWRILVNKEIPSGRELGGGSEVNKEKQAVREIGEER